MKRRRCLVVAVMAMLACATIPTPSQTAPLEHPEVVLSKLSPPIFPPLARAAHILGDVEIDVRIRRDGSVQSAEVVSGHPMLKAAALDSARQSKFECHECREALTPYSILYSFGYTTTQDCCKDQETSATADQEAQPRVGTQSRNHITILTEPLCTCDPSADVVRVRAAKCLFLWRCGKH